VCEGRVNVLTPICGRCALAGPHECNPLDRSLTPFPGLDVDSGGSQGSDARRSAVLIFPSSAKEFPRLSQVRSSGSKPCRAGVFWRFVMVNMPTAALRCSPSITRIRSAARDEWRLWKSVACPFSGRQLPIYEMSITSSLRTCRTRVMATSTKTRSPARSSRPAQQPKPSHQTPRLFRHRP
jgi:hypothetical protein